MKAAKNDQLKEAIVCLLKNRIGVDMIADVCVNPDGKGFVVSYIPTDESGRAGGLNKQQAKMMEEDGEMTEYFDSAEEAAELFLRIRGEYQE